MILAAALTAATYAYAVDQTPKNGCTSPQAYVGSLTSPAVNVPVSAATVQFDGWFEVESVSVGGGIDSMTVEYNAAPGHPDDQWVPFGNLTDTGANPTVVPPSGTSAPDIPYSNNGTSAQPSFDHFSFDVPAGALGQSNVLFRIHFDSGDSQYQGFRGVGVDNVSIDRAVGALTQNFNAGEQGAVGWTFDGASGPGGPFWSVPVNPGGIAVKSPEINPNLVTLPDPGNLPGNGSRYAWFGNPDSGTFCGPDFASTDVAPDTTITSGPPNPTASGDASFEFAATEPAFFECQLDGGGFSFCASPQAYSELANGTHTFEVRATDFTGNVDPTPAGYTWTIRAATLADLPDPEVGVDVNVQQLAGVVKVGIPSKAARAAGVGHVSQKGVTFVPLSEAKQIPVGSFLDTRKGTVGLQSAANRSGKRQTGKFKSGLFQVRQSRKRSARGLTDLVMKGGKFGKCRARRSKGASAALSRAQIRRLRSSARGRFRTSGRNSSATVRGTIWDVTDRCDGTLTHVKRGTVIVRDFRRKKNVTVKTGKSYLARAKGS